MLKKFFGLMLVGLSLAMSPSFSEAADVERKIIDDENYRYCAIIYKRLWICSYCKKEVLLSPYDSPYDHRELVYGCPKNKVEGTHYWWGHIVYKEV